MITSLWWTWIGTDKYVHWMLYHTNTCRCICISVSIKWSEFYSAYTVMVLLACHRTLAVSIPGWQSGGTGQSCSRLCHTRSCSLQGERDSETIFFSFPALYLTLTSLPCMSFCTCSKSVQHNRHAILRMQPYKEHSLTHDPTDWPNSLPTLLIPHPLLVHS